MSGNAGRCSPQLLAALRQLRRLSTAAEPPQELPSLKAALRAVYKRVHPDLFQDHAAAQEANTRSVKLLHEYLEQAREGSRVPVPFRFHFYVRAATAAAAAAGHASAGAAAAGAAPAPAPAAAEPATAPAPPSGLREVSLMLPPPTRGAPGEAMSATTRKAFGRLLSALGLPSHFGGGGANEEAAAAEFNRHRSLREFLPAAVETAHQHAAAAAGAQVQLGALRTALRLGRRVTAGFGEPLASAGVLQQLPALRRLVAVLDSLPPREPDLGGLTFMLGGQSNAVDALGAVWLAANGTDAAWASHLSSVDASHCRERQRLRQAVRGQEAAVAAALGLSMVYTQQDASLSPQHRQALERLADAAAARGPVGGGRFAELPVMLRRPGEGPPPASGGGGGAAEGCAADTEAGLLSAPADVSAEQLYASVEQLGGQVLAALRRRQQQEQDLAALRTQVERKVLLRRLLRHPAVTDAEYRSCLARMLAHAQKLSGLLHGQAVRVAQVNGMSPARDVIDVAWNWQM